MTTTELLEYPLPVIKINVEKLSIKTSGRAEGAFIVKNTGGSELEGRISSNLRGLKFSPVVIKGNKTEIKYSFDSKIYKKGDIINSSVLIMSNGGEIIVPVEVRITAPAIKTASGEEIDSLKDFMFFSKKDFREASRLFASKEFSDWLKSINYENMAIYEYFVKDKDSARGLDNFLMLGGLKNKAGISILENSININIKPFESDAITGVIPLKIKGWGFINAGLTGEAPWLKLMVNKISASDFDDNGFYEASFIIYPNLIKKKVVSCRLSLIDSRERYIDVTVCRERELYLRLNKKSYLDGDNGVIIADNNTFKDLMLEVQSDKILRFEGRRYLIGAHAEIPFSIRLGALQSAQYSLKKQPVIDSEITVSAYADGKKIEKNLKLVIGRLY